MAISRTWIIGYRSLVGSGPNAKEATQLGGPPSRRPEPVGIDHTAVRRRGGVARPKSPVPKLCVAGYSERKLHRRLQNPRIAVVQYRCLESCSREDFS